MHVEVKAKGEGVLRYENSRVDRWRLVTIAQSTSTDQFIFLVLRTSMLSLKFYGPPLPKFSSKVTPARTMQEAVDVDVWKARE
jgi:hypothetical protein